MTSCRYWLTEAGRKALLSDRSVPASYRLILGRIQGETSAAEIVCYLSAYSARQVETWLDELESLQFIEPARVPDASTGSKQRVGNDFGLTDSLAGRVFKKSRSLPPRS